jgi:hypothetical protein
MNDAEKVAHLERKLDAAITRLKAEKTTRNAMRDWRIEEWLSDIINDLEKD